VKTRFGLAAALAAGMALAISSTAAASSVTLVQISSDPFTNSTSQHRTQVEPDTYAFGSTIVAAVQTGRFFSGGSSDIGWATSVDGGSSWTHGVLPGITPYNNLGGSYPRVSDPSVAFDARDDVWMISSIPIASSGVVPTVLVNRSTNGGTSWAEPVAIPQPVGVKVDLDKNWTACDNNTGSPFFGNCYTEFDNFAQGDVVYMSTSSDGGETWGTPLTMPSKFTAIGGQPVVQPNGTVIVPIQDFNPQQIAAFMSTDGGKSWTNPVTVDRIQFRKVAGNLRTSPLPSAEIDGAGRVFVAWEDCGFEPNCSANDIVFSTSTDGVSWTAKARVPINTVGSGADYFIPGIAVDPATSGSTAHLGLSYYYYPVANCGQPNTPACQLFSGFISSGDGGATWGGTTTTSGPMDLTWLALTSQGYMVGDYESTSFSGGVAYPAVVVAQAPSGSIFDEAMYTVRGGFKPIRAGTGAASRAGASAASSAQGSTTNR
jgi:hypothetical protein